MKNCRAARVRAGNSSVSEGTRRARSAAVIWVTSRPITGAVETIRRTGWSGVIRAVNAKG